MADVFPLKSGREFDPVQTLAMGEAFELACELVKDAKLDGLNRQELRELLAHRVIEMAELGETDPQKLANYAVTMFKL
jgi:hypothetical protein